MGLEVNYNSRIVQLYTMADGTFTLQTSAGRVSASFQNHKNTQTVPATRVAKHLINDCPKVIVK